MAQPAALALLLPVLLLVGVDDIEPLPKIIIIKYDLHKEYYCCAMDLNDDENIAAAAASCCTRFTGAAGELHLKKMEPSSFGTATHLVIQQDDHTVNSDGALEFPVFHRNHPCAQSVLGPTAAAAAGETMQQQQQEEEEETSISVTKDSKLNDFAFLIPVKLGTPAVQYLVTMDTGSSLSWVQCRPCTIKCHVQPAKVGPIFDPSNSSTFRHVGCSTCICSYLGRTLRIQSKACMEWEDICLYTMSYGGGMDTQYSTHKEAGIFGLGTSNYSFEQIAPLLSYKAFSYCLPSDEAHQGYLSIGPDSSGGVPTSMFPGTPRPVYSIGMTGLTVTVNGEVRSLVSGSGSSPSPSSLLVVDSGAKLTLLLASTFGQLEDAIIPAMESLGYSLNTAAGQNQLCFLTESDRQNYLQRKPPPPSNWSALPVFHISFTLGLTLTLPPKNAFYLDARYRQEFLTIVWEQIHVRSIFPFQYFSDILGLCSSFARDDYLESGYQILGNLGRPCIVGAARRAGRKRGVDVACGCPEFPLQLQLTPPSFLVFVKYCSEILSQIALLDRSYR
ncbi:hypothetical protein OsI_21206 [Oryza sativa Indica Group]|uniref:Peptidase A1 domain-containing protein n=1 Tax=Oryza sativa subsp. indica TaxID=39946 RepID=B8AX96_ORYSI|nr:hypothetical protein OsI_21206 [Oryza sativa Indica Group]